MNLPDWLGEAVSTIILGIFMTAFRPLNLWFKRLKKLWENHEAENSDVAKKLREELDTLHQEKAHAEKMSEQREREEFEEIKKIMKDLVGKVDTISKNQKDISDKVNTIDQSQKDISNRLQDVESKLTHPTK